MRRPRFGTRPLVPLLVALAACGVGDGGPLTPAPDDAGVVYRVTSLVGPLGARHSVAYDLNDAGQVVGSVDGTRSVVWTVDADGRVVSEVELAPLPAGPPTVSQARGVNDRGQVVGWYVVGRARPYVWTEAGGVVELDLPDGLASGGAYDINDAGLAVGWGAPDGTEPGVGARVLLWRVGAEGGSPVVRDLGSLGGAGAKAHAVNEAGHVTGVVWLEDGRAESFLWMDGAGVRRFPFGDEALGIDDRARVVGATPSGVASMWREGTVTQIGPPGSLARAINNAGLVVGELRPGARDAKGLGFVWERGVLYPLETLSAVEHGRARSINQAGVVSGESYLPELGVSEAVLWIPG